MCLLSACTCNVTREGHFYQGGYCRADNEWPAAECPLPGGACYPGSNCSQFTAGRFAAAHPKLSPAEDQHTTAKCADSDMPGHVSSDRWVADDPDCEFHWHNAAEAVNCLRHVRLLIAGDSLLRQVFHRLVSFIRGFPSVIEHGFWGDAAYSLIGSEDLYLPLTRLPAVRGQGPMVEVEFQWQPAQLSVANITRTKADVLVLGLNYHRVDNLSDTPAVLDQIVSNASPKYVYWVATPYLHQNQTKQQFGPAFIAAIGQRNSRMRDWVKAARAKWPNTSFGIIPLDAMASTNKFARSEDMLHFHCWIPRVRLPLPISHMEWRPTMDSDCRDMAGLNVIQLVLNMMCP
jgi:hypothetical protein